jgi:metal-dependent amidase/aminoacylase/carboxypeptidase family protein
VTVRSFTPVVRERLMAAIRRNLNAEAAAAGAPREPVIELFEGANALVNDPALTGRVKNALVRELGAAARDTPPEMASEDFAEFQRVGVPTLMLKIGAVEQTKYDAAMKSGTPLPALHSAVFAPPWSRH